MTGNKPEVFKEQMVAEMLPEIMHEFTQECSTASDLIFRLFAEVARLRLEIDSTSYSEE